MINLKLADIFQDGMVLQRDKPIKIWGKANPNEKVQITLGNGDSESVMSGSDGTFATYLKPHQPTFDTKLSILSDESHLTINNVQIGEVFLLAGQSNMNLILRYDHDFHADKNQVLSGLPSNIAFYEVPKMKINDPSDPFYGDKGSWKKLNKDTAEHFSAAGYYFGMRIAKQFPDLPIGLVWMAYDGTTASSWTSKQALENNPILKKTFIDSYDKLLADRPKGEYEKFLAMVKEQSKNPKNAPFWDNVLMGNVDHKTLCDAYKNHHELFVDYVLGPESENRPHGLFDTMASKIVGYTIKAMLWYQGESDDDHAEVYDTLLSTMINDWRSRWHDNFPVLEMQVAPFYHWFGVFYGTYFPEIRLKQEQVARKMAKVYMTNVMDAGMKYDIHPKNKRVAGDRFANLTLDTIYGLKQHEEAPLLANTWRNGNQLVVSFTETNQLYMKESLNDSLAVEIAGQNVAYTPKVYENRLILTLKQDIKANEPVMIRYQDEPYSEATIFNENNIPLSPFKVGM